VAACLARDQKKAVAVKIIRRRSFKQKRGKPELKKLFFWGAFAVKPRRCWRGHQEEAEREVLGLSGGFHFLSSHELAAAS
jgi:hypothetical protein